MNQEERQLAAGDTPGMPFPESLYYNSILDAPNRIVCTQNP